MTDVVQKAEVETQSLLLCDTIVVEYVGGSTDGAKCSFTLLIISADMSSGGGHCRHAGGPVDASSLASALLPSVLGQMHSVPLR